MPAARRGLAGLHNSDPIGSGAGTVASLSAKAKPPIEPDPATSGRPVAGGRAELNDASPQSFAVFERDDACHRFQPDGGTTADQQPRWQQAEKPPQAH